MNAGIENRSDVVHVLTVNGSDGVAIVIFPNHHAHISVVAKSLRPGLMADGRWLMSRSIDHEA